MKLLFLVHLEEGKPDPSIFEHALSLLNIEKEQALMVGDNLMTDILGAKRAGIKSVWINRHDKERNEVIPILKFIICESYLIF